MGTWKEDSLKHKYAVIPEEPLRHKKKKKKNRPKKANHKHEYKNCVIKYKFPDNWAIGRTEDGWTTTFASYCPVCGKIGWTQKDNVLAKLCPHIYISHFSVWTSSRASEEERKIFDTYVEEHYPIFVIEDFYDGRLSGQVFLDNEQLDSVR